MDFRCIVYDNGLGFPKGRDSATFQDKGTEVVSLSWDKTGQSRKGRSITGKGRSKTEKEVLKQENDVLNQESWSFFLKFFSAIIKIEIHFVPGRPGTEEFVPRFLLLPLSKDKGTTGRSFLWKH